MEPTPAAGRAAADDAAGDADAVERHPCPQCAAPAGSTCRTRAGRTAARYHTARFALVASLRYALAVVVPPARHPGRAWAASPRAPIRIGYARTSTATQELASQLDALARAGCARVFSEQISTRITVRPEFEAALALVTEIKTAAPTQPVILCVHTRVQSRNPSIFGSNDNRPAPSSSGSCSTARATVGCTCRAAR